MKRDKKVPQFQTIGELNNFLSKQYEFGFEGMTIELLLEEYARVKGFHLAVINLAEKMTETEGIIGAAS